MAEEERLALLEIEHKFIVGDDFQLDPFLARCESLEPLRRKQLDVRDCYYSLPGRRDIILRHRFDAELQQFTLKSRGRDSEIRDEINLGLLREPDQKTEIRAWTQLLGASEPHQIDKSIWVFEFPDCEVVYYEARYAAQGREIQCVEIEARGAATVKEALATLERYEQLLGFQAAARSHADLFSLLISDLIEGAELLREERA